jgi:hypothetical protein
MLPFGPQNFAICYNREDPCDKNSQFTVIKY